MRICLEIRDGQFEVEIENTRRPGRNHNSIFLCQDVVGNSPL